MILSGASTLSQSGSGSNSNEGVLYIPQSPKTGVSPSDGSVSQSRYSKGGGESYPSAKMQSVNSKAQVNSAIDSLILTACYFMPRK